MSSQNPIDKLAENLKTAQGATAPKTAPAPVQTESSVPKVPVSNEQLILLLQEVAQLKKAQAEGDAARAKALASKKPEIDWTKISEKDITNLDLDIPVIQQEKPVYMEVHLLDKMYVARWIHKMPQRLGMCLAEGYMFVKKEDMDPQHPIILGFDESGNYSCGDVVCMRILKSRYYPALKANYLRTMAIHGKTTLRKAVETGKSGIQLDRKGNEIRMGGIEPEHIDPSRLNVFDPGDEPSKGEKEYTREMVQI